MEDRGWRAEKKLPLSCAPARDKIFAQEWHSVDKIRFENERMPGNEQGTRHGLPHRRMVAKAVAKQSPDTVVGGWGGGVLKESGLVAGKDNNFINKYLCAQQSCLRSFAFRF